MTIDTTKLKEISIPAYSLWKNSRKPSDDLYPANDMANHIAQTVLAQQEKIERLEEERDNLQRQVYGLLQNEADRLAARQGERE